MQYIHAQQVASITELKRNPTKLIKDANGQPVAILNHNVAAAYLIPSETFERMLDLLDDVMLAEMVQQRLTDGSQSIEVDIDEL